MAVIGREQAQERFSPQGSADSTPEPYGGVSGLLPVETRNYLKFALARAERELLDLERRQREEAGARPYTTQAANPRDDLNRQANAKRLEIKWIRAQLGEV